MGKRRRNFSSSFKAKVALEAIKGIKTLNQLAGEYSVHPNAIGKWKKELLENAPDIFDKQRGKKNRLAEEDRDYLYQEIGKLQVELAWLKKKFGLNDS